VAGQLTKLVYQAAATSSAAATPGPAIATGPVSALYPNVTPRQDLGFTPANLGGAFEGLDLNLLGISHLAGFKPQGLQQPSTAEDYQLVLGVERVRVPELLYQPAALAGVDQAGFAEVLGLVFQRLPKHIGDAVAAGGVVLTGGNACFAGRPSYWWVLDGRDSRMGAGWEGLLNPAGVLGFRVSLLSCIAVSIERVTHGVNHARASMNAKPVGVE